MNHESAPSFLRLKGWLLRKERILESGKYLLLHRERKPNEKVDRWQDMVRDGEFLVYQEVPRHLSKNSIKKRDILILED